MQQYFFRVLWFKKFRFGFIGICDAGNLLTRADFNLLGVSVDSKI